MQVVELKIETVCNCALSNLCLLWIRESHTASCDQLNCDSTFFSFCISPTSSMCSAPTLSESLLIQPWVRLCVIPLPGTPHWQVSCSFFQLQVWFLLNFFSFFFSMIYYSYEICLQSSERLRAAVVKLCKFRLKLAGNWLRCNFCSISLVSFYEYDLL